MKRKIFFLCLATVFAVFSFAGSLLSFILFGVEISAPLVVVSAAFGAPLFLTERATEFLVLALVRN